MWDFSWAEKPAPNVKKPLKQKSGKLVIVNSDAFAEVGKWSSADLEV